MKNKTTHQCELSCSSPISYPNILHLNCWRKSNYGNSHSLIITIMPVYMCYQKALQPECLIAHKYTGAHHYASVYVSTDGSVD